MSNPRRRKIIEQLEEEGRQAYRAGKSYDSNPRIFEDRKHWSNGWAAAALEHKEQQAIPVEAAKITIERIFPEHSNTDDFHTCAVCGCSVHRHLNAEYAELHYAYHEKRGDL